MDTHESELDSKQQPPHLESIPEGVADLEESSTSETAGTIEIPDVETVVGDSFESTRPKESIGLIPQITQSQEKTRATIALTFTQVFLFLVIAAFILPTLIHLLDTRLIPEPIPFTKDLLTTIASILAGPFGFIVGFYFKKDSN